MVYGEGRNFLTALLVPHWGNLRQALKTQGINVDHEREETLARHPAAGSLLRQRIDAAFKDVSSSEQIKKFVILPAPFTVGGEELTVSLKLRRKVIQAKYAALLEALYQEAGGQEGCGE